MKLQKRKEKETVLFSACESTLGLFRQRDQDTEELKDFCPKPWRAAGGQSKHD